MEINSLLGLPAHPLIVHAAVVLLPIAAIALIVVAAIPRARHSYGPIVFGVALAATIAVTVVSALVAAEPYARTRLGKVSPRVVTAVLVGSSLIVGIGATYTVIEVGHSGATSVWNDVGKEG